jgi:hypothetical protein
MLVRDAEGGREPQAFLCTDLNADPTEILGWFVRRWRVEVTLAEVRRHLGVETQRQWSDLAILRTTPALLGLFLLVTLWADRIKGEHGVQRLVNCQRRDVADRQQQRDRNEEERPKRPCRFRHRTAGDGRGNE